MTRRRTSDRRSGSPPLRETAAHEYDLFAGRRAAGALVLIGATMLAYVPALRGGFIWDDDDYVTDNPALASLAGLVSIWLQPGAVPQYYPLTFTSLWLDHQLWGVAPAGYHVVNVLLHVANALLAWLVLRRLALPGAWLAAAVFALHPVHVESVAWITERKNVLSGTFYLGALLAYLRFAALGTSPTGVERRRSYALAVALFVCALLSKTVTCTLPAVILLLLWWKRGRVTRADALATVPLFALGGGLALVTIWMERFHVGAHGAAWMLSPVDRVLIAGRAVWFYAAKLVWPQPLTFVYPRWDVDAGAWWQYVFPLGAAAVIALLFFARARVGRGPLVALVCFVGTLAPALGFVDVYPMRYSFVADHYQYLASIALIALMVASASREAMRSRATSTARASTPVAIGVLLLLAALTWRQATIYRDQETLWRDTLAKNPAASMARVNLGLLLHQRGHLEDARVQFGEALRLDPADWEVHGNLGITLATMGRRSEARAHFEEALRLAPDAAGAHNNLANLLFIEGRIDDAAMHYREAVRLAPSLPDAHNNLANTLVRQGKNTEAVAHYQEALRLDPRYTEAHYNLGAVLASEGRADEAVPHLREAVRLSPAHEGARATLAAVLAREPAQPAR